MKKVKVHSCHNNGSIFNTGQWVKHEDYLKLQAELEEVRKECEWIPVTERLPEESGKYVCYANDGLEIYIVILNAYICPEYGDITWEDDEHEEFAADVTHYKPSAITPPNK